MTLLEFAGQIGGIAGVMAVIMFLVYRQDRKQSEDRLRQDRNFIEEKLTHVLDNYSEDCRRQTEAFGEVKEVLRELITWLKRKNGNG